MQENYQDLANAIIEQAAKDYIKAVRFLLKHPKNPDAMYTKRECERFFNSEWYKMLTPIDGRWLRLRLKEEACSIDG